MDTKNIWNIFLDKIKSRVSPLTFETWFKDSSLFELKENSIVILVPMHIHKKHLNENYKDLINEIFTDITNTYFEISFITNDEITGETAKVEEKEIGVPSFSPEKANLISKYTFENFVVGDSNKFAHTAAVSIAENPGKMYNPLFIYSSSGLGKTHLMHAIGNHILKNSNKKILYVTSDTFISDFLNINKKDQNGSNFDSVDFFKEKYRNIDVLLIDDIQFLSRATQTQQEFFHTFNNLYDSNKQIVISSDRSPDDLKLLEDRLRTRFSWGLSVNIYPPDYKMRIEILKKKIKSQKIENIVNEDVIEYIANNCESDVRQLEGALTRVIAYATIYNCSNIDINIAIEALKDYLSKASVSKNSVQKIQQVVSDYFKVTTDDLKSKKRLANITHPRQIAMYLCRKLTDESFPRIGMYFGGRDHSTVVHSCNKIEKEIKLNNSFKEMIETIIKKI